MAHILPIVSTAKRKYIHIHRLGKRRGLVEHQFGEQLYSRAESIQLISTYSAEDWGFLLYISVAAAVSGTPIRSNDSVLLTAMAENDHFVFVSIPLRFTPFTEILSENWSLRDYLDIYTHSGDETSPYLTSKSFLFFRNPSFFVYCYIYICCYVRPLSIYSVMSLLYIHTSIVYAFTLRTNVDSYM